MRAKTSALLIDFDNLEFRHRKPLVENIANWLAWLEDGGFDPSGQKRNFVRKRVYWNIGHDDVNRLPFKRRLFETRVCRAVRNKDKASSADFDITIDAAELRHDFKKLEEVIILSYDSDFLTVMNHLQEFAIDVVGMARGSERPAIAFRELSDFVIEHDQFRDAFSYERTKRSLLDSFAPKAPKSAPPPVAPKKVARAEPAKKAPSPATKPRTFNIKGAAQAVAKAAATSQSPRLSKKFVTQTLTGFDGFATTGVTRWLGCGDYPSMIRQFAEAHQPLGLETTSNGGLMLIDKAPARAS